MKIHGLETDQLPLGQSPCTDFVWSATSVHVARGNMRLGLKILLDLGARALAIPNRAPPLKRSLCEKQRTATPPSLAALASGSFSSQRGIFVNLRTLARRHLKMRTIVQIDGLRRNDIPMVDAHFSFFLYRRTTYNAQISKHPVPPSLILLLLVPSIR